MRSVNVNDWRVAPKPCRFHTFVAQCPERAWIHKKNAAPWRWPRVEQEWPTLQHYADAKSDVVEAILRRAQDGD